MMNIEQIMRILPHRYPFLLVDRVISCEDKKIHAIKNVTINEDYFNGHFGNHPVMPGVLIIEALAQAAVLLVGRNSDVNLVEDKIVYFSAIESVYFKKPVVPGDTLHLHIEEIKYKLNTWKMSANAFVDDKKVTEAIFLATLVDRKAHNTQSQ